MVFQCFVSLFLGLAMSGKKSRKTSGKEMNPKRKGQKNLQAGLRQVEDMANSFVSW